MVTTSSLQMPSDLNVQTTRGERLRGGSHGHLEDSLLGNDIGLMLRERHGKEVIDQERDLNLCRSGSAPPTVEGSLTAVGSLFRNSDAHLNRNEILNGSPSEEEIRSHPAYLSYYYSHENLNPRLPPPLLSKEDWRVAQRFQAGTSSFGGIGEMRKQDSITDSYSKSLFSLQPGLPTQNGEADFMELRKVTPRNHMDQLSAEWLEKDTDGLIGLAGVGLGAKRKSLADLLQEGLVRPTPVSGHLSRPVSRNAFDDVVDPMGVSDPQLIQLHNVMDSVDGLNSRGAGPSLVRGHNPSSSVSQSFASAVGSSLSRSTTPEAQLVARSPGPGLPPTGGRASLTDKKNVFGKNAFNGLSPSIDDHADIAATLSGLSLSKNRLVGEDSHLQSQLEQEFDSQPNLRTDILNAHRQRLQQQLMNNSDTTARTIPSMYQELSKNDGNITDLNLSRMSSNGHLNFTKAASSGNLYKKAPYTGSPSLEGSTVHYQHSDMPDVDFSGYTSGSHLANNRLNSVTNNHLNAGPTLRGGAGQSLNRNNQLRTDLQVPVVDPLYVQYLQRTSDYAAQAATNLSDPSFGRNYIGTSHADLLGLQKAYLEALIAQQKHYSMPFVDKTGGINHAYCRSPSYGLGMPYPGNPMAGSALSPVRSGSSMLQNERLSRFPSSMTRGSTGGAIGGWQVGNGGNMEESYGSSLLEEFKNNKTRCFELSEIVDHVVEFSTDQYGSRFIQQKLESASVDEKNKIFPEIIPHARSLMTDVFGNYVIQKFFEHGTETQTKELANQLNGHVLPLSLQMYGCRVIQKALEVVDVDQQTQMVAELDGSIMKCVRDQNGNHVIQKCIECVPQDRIQFIISSFYGQVVALSTHPYGCRVIQRVLEHCNDANTQHIIMEEILESVCTLAQDQYGNYVVQHVLQHGKPHERSAIINKLAGQIVKMSQQKFASNVVEKCLTFGGPEERQVLVNEMLGSTDENEPLQAMMKDQFGNYVVQKVLETCDNYSRELILSRIKVHLNALKRYTYGKHIVARVEKLLTAGERRIGISSSYSS